VQLSHYKRLLQRDLIEIDNQSKTESNRALTLYQQLTQLCLHPYLLPEFSNYETNENLINFSGKFIVLDKLLKQLRDQKHKVLIFSQFTTVLDLVEQLFLYRGYTYYRLTGATNRIRRAIDIRRFNDKNNDVFCYLLSTRAGGVGISLTAADTVIHMSTDDNPQQDLQSQARAHRIGQTNQVNVYRLIAEETVEQRIIMRIERKLYLHTLLIAETEAHNRFSASSLVGRINSSSSTVNNTTTANKENNKTSDILDVLTFGAYRMFTTNLTTAEQLTDQHILALINPTRKEDNNSSISSNINNDSSSNWDKLIHVMKSNNESKINNNFNNTFVVDQSNQQTSLQQISAEVIIQENIEHKVSSFDVKSELQPINSFQGNIIHPTPNKQLTEFDLFNNQQLLLSFPKFDRQAKQQALISQDYNNAYIHETSITSKSAKHKRYQDWEHDNICFICKEDLSLNINIYRLYCKHCPRVLHESCVGIDRKENETRECTNWTCYQHRCFWCNRSISEAGGLLFRCIVCCCCYCDEHVPQERFELDNCNQLSKQHYVSKEYAFYIVCSLDCIKYHSLQIDYTSLLDPLPHYNYKGQTLEEVLNDNTLSDEHYCAWMKLPSSVQQKRELLQNGFKNSLYCICKKPNDPNRLYIQCSSCNNWFHLDCMEIDAEDIANLAVFICLECEANPESIAINLPKTTIDKPIKITINSSEQEVVEFLREINLDNLINLFIANHINGEIMFHLTEYYLQRMKVQPEQAKYLLQSIQQYSQQA
jgi:SWI/SNF-related matrix-associated actin-dependent regulator of chromatin subfamily A member 5